jgi:microcystin-dependent protein
MKKTILALALLLPLSSSTLGNVPCTLPFNLQNGTPADATQVMANYQALVNCLAQAAVQGVNNDITALTALTTPIPPAGGGTPLFIGGTSAGTANAQTVTPTPAFTPTLGYQVSFTAGFTNTGAMTLTVGSAPAFAVFRRTQLGISPTVGGELIAGQRVAVAYDGTQYQIISNDPVRVGQMTDFASGTPPAGWVAADGTCQLRTGIFADLFSVIGTSYAGSSPFSCDVNHFNLPDTRGRVLTGFDAGTGRLAGCTSIGAACGAQNVTLGVSNIPQMTGSTTTGTASTSFTATGANSAIRFFSAAVAAGGDTSCAPGAGACGGAGFTGLVNTPVFTGDLQTISMSNVSVSVNVGTASPSAFSVVQPTLGVVKIIKY